MAELHMQNYEEFRQKEDVTYDEIKMDKEKIETNKLVITSRNQWLKHFLLILTISAFSAGVASTVTYFTVCAQLKQFTLDLIEMKLTDIERKNEIRVQEMEKRYNLTSSHLQKQSNDSVDLVGFTAIGSHQGIRRSSGYQLKFSIIISSVGISNRSSMENTGTFICEKKGLYLVIVTVMACSSGDSGFYIYKNNQLYMDYFIIGRSHSDNSREICHSGTGTAVVKIRVKDTLSVRNRYGGVRLFENWSSFSAVKLK